MLGWLVAGPCTAYPLRRARRTFRPPRAADDPGRARARSSGAAGGALPRVGSRHWSATGGLEELDRIARGVVEHDLPAARPADDVVAEGHSGAAQAGDVAVDVIDDEVEAV